MAAMTEETTALPPELDVNIDPASWEDPKETFPGVVEVSQKRFASAEYKAGKTFWEGFDPDAHEIPQWDIRVRRLDAVILLPDGQQVPAIRYGTIDLRKWSNRERKFVGLSSRYTKEWEIVNAWKKVFGKVEPPTALEGRKGMFEFFRSKSFAGSSMPAKNVLLPVSILLPDYEYDGEVTVFTARERPTEDTVVADATPETDVPNATTPLDIEEVIPFLKGANRNKVGDIVSNLPAELRQPQLISALATGTLFDELTEAGKIAVATDGTISLL